jgi:hypothetical protein
MRSISGRSSINPERDSQAQNNISGCMLLSWKQF